MIEKLLEAYETEKKRDNSFWKRQKRMDMFTRILFWTVSLSSILIFTATLFFPSETTYIITIIYIVVVYILTEVLERNQHKNWKNNTEKYCDELNTIAEILKDENFNLYEKKKLKQLIRKYHQSIEEYEKKAEKKDTKDKVFLNTYIIPIIAFFAGGINNVTATNTEWVTIGVVVVILVVGIKYLSFSITELKAMVSWNEVEKEKQFVKKLQDLLDRDFVIETEDLI